MSHCRRPVREQKLIFAALEAYGSMPPHKKSEVRSLIGDIAADGNEGKALFDVLVKGISPETAGARHFVTAKRIYQMRTEFYDRIQIW